MGMFGNWSGMPLVAMGAGILGGRDLNDGISQGARMAIPMARQAQEEQDWRGTVAGVTDPSMRRALEVLGPSQGRAAYGQHLMQQAQGPKSEPRPWWASESGAVHPAMRVYRELGRPQTNVSVNGGRMETEYDKAMGKALADEFVKAQQSTASTRVSLGNMQQMEQALDDPSLYTGTGGEQIQYLKKAAGTLFGVDVRGVPAGEVVQVLGREIALSAKDKLPGPMSDSDRRFLVDMAPGLTRTPDGNRAIIRIGMLAKQYELARSQVMLDFARQNGGRLTPSVYENLGRVDEEFAQKFSTHMQSLRSLAPIPQPSPTVGTPINLDELRRRYGLE